MKQYFNKIHYSDQKSLPDAVLENFLSIFSLPYYIGSFVRNYLYRVNYLKKTKLPAYVISVGNLTTGGTGKTPLTAEIAKYIKNKYNKNVAILSRGYGGQLSVKDVNIISDGRNIYSTAHLAGDEPYWMASNLDNIIVLTGQDRIKTGTYAIESLDADVLILDDGFQHIRLERDLNILVIDANKKFGNRKILPAGPLRESVSQINRADKIIFVDKNGYDEKPATDNITFMENIKAKFNKPSSICRFINGGIFNIKSSEEIDASFKNVYAFAGIAQPEFFFNSLKQNNYNLVYTRLFADHHLYTKEDLINMTKEAVSLNADCIITTEKDAVKLLAFVDEVTLKVPVYAQKVSLDIKLENIIDENISNKI
ncbi:MAG: tetraacyldisaccharide 4'-kinase [Candidatus Gastranaerophilales bacterium]|nr:tetraacyldisaccharide 4'-kinase [Candidatus Gastranaerophilales bacterium]